MSAIRLVFAAAALAGIAAAQEHINIPTEDGGLLFADVYGKGDHGVVLAHGGRFTKESWAKQAQTIAAAGFRVLAFDFRGFGQSWGPGQADMYTAPLHLDVLAAVRYLRATGSKTISVVGGSFGGSAAGKAVTEAKPGEIQRLVLLATTSDGPPEKLKLPKLFIVARDDSNGAGPRLPGIQAQYERAPEPKKLVVVEGSAHAQFLFNTDQGDRVMTEILRFLSAP